ncbi:hypothetical protein [Rhodoglobus sp.]
MRRRLTAQADGGQCEPSPVAEAQVGADTDETVAPFPPLPATAHAARASNDKPIVEWSDERSF